MVFGLGQRRAQMIAELNAASEPVETARGPVEFARRGGPPVVLLFHGTPQGHFASTFAEPFEAVGFGTITPSRPGYLRTPLETGPSFAAQADAAAALLDELSIDNAAVYAISGGGPSGIEFAARHPERTRALILEVAISGSYQIAASRLATMLLTNPAIAWIQWQILQRLPRLAVDQFVKLESTLERADRTRVVNEILSSPKKLAFLRRLVGEMPHFDLLRSGYENDIKRFGGIEHLPLDQIRCPTLVVHGTHDGDVPFSHAERSARDIAGATLHRVEKGWHLLALSDGAEAVVDAEVRFVQEQLAQ